MAILLIQLTWKNIPWNFNASWYKTFNNLKSTFTSTPIFIYWISNTQIIMETNILNYTLIAILSIIIEEKVYLVGFYSHMFNTTKLNYNTYNKKFSVVFEAFHI